MFQQVILVGNVGRDPEVVTFQDGSTITKFSLATKKTWKDQQGQKQEKTTWHDIQVRGNQQAYVQQYVKSGSKVQILGEIDINIKKDDQGNTTAKYHSISAQRVLGLDSVSQTNSIAGGQVGVVQGVTPMPNVPQQQFVQQPVQQPVQYAQQAVPQVQAAPMQAAPMQAAPQQAPIQYTNGHDQNAAMTEDGIPF